MVIHSWDELSEEWAEHTLDIERTTDPVEINKAFGRLLVGDGPCCNEDECDSPDGWELTAHSWAGPVLTIITRSDRNHLGIMVVNFEQYGGDK